MGRRMLRGERAGLLDIAEPQASVVRPGRFARLRQNRLVLAVGSGIAVLGLSIGTVSASPQPTKQANTEKTHPTVPHDAHERAVSPEVLGAEAAAAAQQAVDYAEALKEAQQIQDVVNYVRAVEAHEALVREQGGTEYIPGGASRAHWEAIHACEQPDGWTAQDDRFGGGLGISNDTWREFGGEEFSGLPSGASPEQQITVANRVFARYQDDAWGCKTDIR